MKLAFLDLVPANLRPFVISGLIILGPSITAKLTTSSIKEWSQRRLNRLKDKENTTAVITRVEAFRRIGGLFIWFTGVIILVSPQFLLKQVNVPTVLLNWKKTRTLKQSTLGFAIGNG